MSHNITFHYIHRIVLSKNSVLFFHSTLALSICIYLFLKLSIGKCMLPSVFEKILYIWCEWLLHKTCWLFLYSTSPPINILLSLVRLIIIFPGSIYHYLLWLSFHLYVCSLPYCIHHSLHFATCFLLITYIWDCCIHGLGTHKCLLLPLCQSHDVTVFVFYCCNFWYLVWLIVLSV